MSPRTPIIKSACFLMTVTAACSSSKNIAREGGAGTTPNDAMASGDATVSLDASGDAMATGDASTCTTLCRFKTLAAQSATQLVRVAAITDSIGWGLYASQVQPIPSATSWVGITRTRLQSQWGDGGSGYVSISACTYWVGSAPYTSSQLPVTLNGSWTFEPSSSTSWGSPNSEDAYSSTNGDTATFRVRGSTIVVYYAMVPAGGNFSVSIDGVTKDANLSASATTAARASKSYSTSSGSHTVVITNVGASGNAVVIQGVDAHNDTGIVLDQYSTPGQSLTQFVAGPNALAYSGAQERKAALLILELGVNDAVGSHSVSDFTTAFNSVTNAFSGTDILYVYQSLGADGTGNTGTLYTSYGAVVQPAVNVFIDCGQLDTNNSYSYGLSIGYWGFYGNPGASGTSADADNVHPSDLGHRMIANDICPYLGVSCIN